MALRRRRRVLHETEAHLRDTAEELVASGLAEREAQHRAIDRFGGPQSAAAAFGSSLPGRAWRSVLRLRYWATGRSAAVATPSEPVPVPPGWAVTPAGPPPSPCCDVCGREVASDDMLVAELSAVGPVESPVTLVVHPPCYDMAAAVLLLRGMPVTADHHPGT